MKADKPPLRIWLQFYGTDAFDPIDGKVKAVEVSWCEDKIYATDVCYIRAGKKVEKRKKTKQL